MDEGDGCCPAACAREAGECSGFGVLSRDAQSLHTVLCFLPGAVQHGRAVLGAGALAPLRVLLPILLSPLLRTDGQAILN